MDHDVILDEPLIVEELEHLGKGREDGLGGHPHQVGVLLAEHGSRLFQSADKNELEVVGGSSLCHIEKYL